MNNVYGLKLQSLALLSLLSAPQLPQSIEAFIPQFGQKLISSIEKLPEALHKRQALLKGDQQEDGDDDYDDDEDSFKDTPLDDVNIFMEFKVKFGGLQSAIPDRYNAIMGSLTPDKVNATNSLLNLSQ